MGGVAVRLHCPKYAYLLDTMKRPPFLDMDFVTYGRFRSSLSSVFTDLGYAPNAHIMLYFGHDQQEYLDVNNGRKVDVFVDKLDYCHRISFAGRLELDTPTITVSDILLQKMQIVKLTDKDIEDAIVLLREHDIGETDQETINARYIARLLSRDWGFCHTVTTNLGKVDQSLSQFESLTGEDRRDVHLKMNRILACVASIPTSLRWKVRAILGTRKKWYNDLIADQ